VIRVKGFASDEQWHRVKLLQMADRAKTLRKIATGKKRFFRFSLSDYPASAKRLQYFAQKCSEHLYAGGRRQK